MDHIPGVGNMVQEGVNMKERYTSYDKLPSMESVYEKILETEREEEIISHNVVYVDGWFYLTIISEKEVK